MMQYFYTLLFNEFADDFDNRVWPVRFPNSAVQFPCMVFYLVPGAAEHIHSNDVSLVREDILTIAIYAQSILSLTNLANDVRDYVSGQTNAGGPTIKKCLFFRQSEVQKNLDFEIYSLTLEFSLSVNYDGS